MPTHQTNKAKNTAPNAVASDLRSTTTSNTTRALGGGGGGSFVATVTVRRGEMRRPRGACGSRSSPAAAFFLVAAAICAQFATVLAADPAKDDDKAESKGHTGQTVVFVLLGIGAAGLVSFFLFKYWQKKKREEQHARLLKLFEEDDDIEMELGLRD